MSDRVLSPPETGPRGRAIPTYSRHSADGTYLEVSSGVADLLGLAPDEVIGTSAYEYFHPDDLAVTAGSHARAVGLLKTTTATYRIRHRDGTYRRVTTTTVQTQNVSTGAVELDCVTVPVRDSEVVNLLERSEDRFSALVERTTEMVAVVASDASRLVYANPLLERVVGVEHGELNGAGFFELFEPASLPRVVGEVGRLLHHPRGVAVMSVPIQHLDGSATPVSMVIQNLTDDPAVQGLLVVAHDVRDPMTGLQEPPVPVRQPSSPDSWERSDLHERLEHLLASPGWVDAGMALMMVRLEDLETIADAYGAPAARLVMDESAQRVSSFSNQINGGIAKLGVSKLGWVVSGLRELEDAQAIGEHVRDLLGLPYQLDSEEVYSSPRVTVGLARPGATAAGLLAAALASLEQAGPGTRVVAFETTRRDVAIGRLRLRTQMQHAIERNEFVLHYQPIVDLATNRVVSTEALIRWEHPDRGLLAPAEFIPIAEASDFIIPLGQWVLWEAGRQLAQWGDQGVPISVSVNISTHQLVDRRLPELVNDVLSAHAVSPHLLHLEVTETAALDQAPYIQDSLEQLNELGVQLTIDDFGTGHASLSYLRRIPARCIKIDRSFVANLDDLASDDHAIVASTIALSHALGRIVVAEGIESRRQLEVVRQLGADRGQGYLFGRPRPPEQLELPDLTRSNEGRDAVR